MACAQASEHSDCFCWVGRPYTRWPCTCLTPAGPGGMDASRHCFAHMWGDGETAVLVDPCLGLGVGRCQWGIGLGSLCVRSEWGK